jgi:hypothetical protein
MANKASGNNSVATVNVNNVRAKYENLVKIENSIDSLEDYIAFQLFMNRHVLNKLTDKYVPHDPKTHEQASKFLLEIMNAATETIGEHFDAEGI